MPLFVREDEGRLCYLLTSDYTDFTDFAFLSLLDSSCIRSIRLIRCEYKYLLSARICFLTSDLTDFTDLIFCAFCVFCCFFFNIGLNRFHRFCFSLAAWRILHPFNPSNPMFFLINRFYFSLAAWLILHPFNPSNPMFFSYQQITLFSRCLTHPASV